jgi:phosphoribosylanthranilate isomerase
MKRIMVQLYEIQEPREAERLIELGVDRIGSVILSPEEWKIPTVRDVVRLTRGSVAKSSLIPLLVREDDILRVLDYYEPDFVHFCELIPLAPDDRGRREGFCAELIRIQQRVKEEFPPLGITRSIPIPGPIPADSAPVRETIVEIARADQPVAGYVGITGEVCDWDLAAALAEATRIPVILGGGISPENVFKAIGHVRPAGIDSCTQTNACDNRGRPIRFRKDFDRVRRLLNEVRRTEEVYSNLRPSAL